METKNAIDNYINIICEKIKYKPIRKDIANEIKNHIEEEKESYMLLEKDEKKAEEQVLLNMGDPNDIGQSLNKIHRPKLDFKLLIIGIFMILFSLLITYPLSNSIYKYYLGSDKWFIKNIIYIAFAIILGIVIYFFDYTKLRKKSMVIYFISTCIGILSIFLNFNQCNSSYINIPILNINILTVDLIVPLYILSFAGFFNISKKSNTIITTFLAIFSLTIVSFCNSLIYLIILFISYVSIFIIEVFKSEKYSKKYKHVSSIILSIICACTITLFILKYTPYRIQIGKTTINPNDKNMYEYQMSSRKKVLKNSKIIGATNLNGNLSDEIAIKDWAYNLQYAESSETLIFIIGKYGILIGTIILLCIFYLSSRIINDIKNIKDSYGKYIMIGFATMIITQSILHVLSNLCLIDVNSATLPLISYSCFGIIINAIIVSTILSIYRRKDILIVNN